MNNQTEKILTGSIVALVGAVAGAIATAVVNLILNRKIDINFWWGWGLGGLFGVIVILCIYQTYQHRKIIYGYKISIRTYDNNYVTADLNQDRQLFGRAQSIKSWQIFEIVDESLPFSQEPNRQVHYGDKIAFKALNCNRFVGADLNHDKQLTTWATRLQGWETFILCPTPNNDSVLGDIVRYGNSFALKAFNEKYVEYILTGDGRLLADAPHISRWETFVFVNPTRSSVKALFNVRRRRYD